jgi:hypothetical protein
VAIAGISSSSNAVLRWVGRASLVRAVISDLLGRLQERAKMQTDPAGDVGQRGRRIRGNTTRRAAIPDRLARCSSGAGIGRRMFVL